MNFNSKKWIILGLLLVVLGILLFIYVFLLKNLNRAVDFRFLGVFSQNPFKKQSQVHVSLIDSKLNFNFDLTEEDKPKFAQFVYNWFGADQEIKTLGFGVDENTQGIISKSVPIDLKLTIKEKSLDFSNNAALGLQNPFIKSDFNFATGSAKLNAEFADSSRYQVKIDNPSDLANYATSSGVLSTSLKIEGLFQSLSKVSTIELNVNGKNISGSILLK